MKNSRQNRLVRQLVTATLLMGGAFNLAAPVLAVGTQAGLEINNTATATYEDPNTPGTAINATSNKVTITVAEVAGISVVASGIDDRNEGSASTNDILDFKFTVTNTGNDGTAIYIPGKTELNRTTNPLIIGGKIADTDADSTKPSSQVYIVAINGQTLKNPVAVPIGGIKTSDPAFIADINDPNKGGYTGTFDGSVAAGSNILVKIPVTVSETTATKPISVQFGNTSPQNAQDVAVTGAGNTDDVRTVDMTETGNTSSAPINGEREAAAFQKIDLATSVQPLALATVLKTRAAYIPNTSAVNDDQIRYRLDLRVESQDNNANDNFAPAPLVGTKLKNNITGTGAPAANTPVILVSDVIPDGTVLDYSSLATQTPLPTGWVRVYSNDDPNGANKNAIDAQWKTTAPANQTEANSVWRVGYIYVGTLAAGSSTVNDANGFQFQVKTLNSFAGGNIINIAQAFGQTQGDSTTTPPAPVYDESGDQQANNFNADGSTPYTDGRGGFDPAADTGIAQATYGSDSSTQTTNNPSSNQGQGQDGEVNLFTIAPVGSILIGPLGTPGATGLGNSNHTDFVNKSITPPAGLDPATALTDAQTSNLTFKNTVNNPNPTALNNVVLKPIAASQADFVADSTAANQANSNTGYGVDATLPTGTTVRINTDGSTTSGALYTWDGIKFNLTSGTAVRLASLNGNTSLDYYVIVNLGDGADQNKAFPVTIATFVDENGDNDFARKADDPATTTVDESKLEPVFNLTVDRTYTGFMKLVKEARLLDKDGTTEVAPFNQSPTFKPQPGQIVEYRISYENISTPSGSGGTGSVLLNASNFKIFEDGKFVANVNSNNWADSTTHVIGKASATTGATTVKYYDAVINALTPGNGVPEATSNTGYVNFVGSVAPNATLGTPQGNFTFQRKVN